MGLKAPGFSKRHDCLDARIPVLLPRVVHPVRPVNCCFLPDPLLCFHNLQRIGARRQSLAEQRIRVQCDWLQTISPTAPESKEARFTGVGADPICIIILRLVRTRWNRNHITAKSAIPTAVVHLPSIHLPPTTFHLLFGAPTRCKVWVSTSSHCKQSTSRSPIPALGDNHQRLELVTGAKLSDIPPESGDRRPKS